MKPISEAVIRRLPTYYRYLHELVEKGEERISSEQLSQLTGFTASQIRQDLNHFGGFGQQGYGYKVNDLYQNLQTIIGLDKPVRIGIVGIGNLGRAIADSSLFSESCNELVGLFDKNPDLVGQELRGVTVQPVEELTQTVKDRFIELIIIATPREVAQQLADQAVAGGVKGIWNFALYDLQLPPDVILENVYMEESLHTLTYYINHPEDYQA